MLLPEALPPPEGLSLPVEAVEVAQVPMGAEPVELPVVLLRPLEQLLSGVL